MSEFGSKVWKYLFYKRSISFNFDTRSLKFGQRRDKLKINQFCSCNFFNIASRKWFIHIKWCTKVHCFRWITCFLCINAKDSIEQKLFIIMSPMRVQIFKSLLLIKKKLWDITFFLSARRCNYDGEKFDIIFFYVFKTFYDV